MPLIDSLAVLNDAAELRRRADEHGYLLFRGLLPEAAVAEVREQVEDCCRRHGFFEQSIVQTDGSMDLDRLRAYYEEAYQLRCVHALPKHAAIVGVYTRLFGRQAVPHARTVLRTMPYGTRQVWPVHQDFLNVGTHEEVWNSWMPVVDCPEDLGAIWILPGSHRIGMSGNRRLSESELFFEADGDLFNNPPAGLQWQTGDLLATDVVMFNSLTYHRGAANYLPGQLRISIDNCIQPVDTPFIPGAFELHTGDFGVFNQGVSWDDIYANWPENEPMRHYWKRMDISFSESIELEFENRS